MIVSTSRGGIAAMLCFVLVSAAFAQISGALVQKAVDAAMMVSMADEKGYVRVIVEFAAPVAAGQLPTDPARLAAVKAQIASMQDAIIASHFGSATYPAPGQGFVRGLVRFDITPNFAVNVSKAELEALAADPRVVRINLDQLHAPG